MKKSSAAKIDRTTPDREEMIERVTALVPSLAQRAEQVEKTRTIHPDTVQEFWDTQLWSIMKPRRYGGLELDYSMLVDVPDYVARGCASTSWIYANLVIHDWMLAMWPPEAQDAVWKDNPRALMASSLIPNAGRATPVAGGYRIAGRWPYCSGIDVSDWMMMAAMSAVSLGPAAVTLSAKMCAYPSL